MGMGLGKAIGVGITIEIESNRKEIKFRICTTVVFRA